jgi:hypothetical protein
MSDADERTSNFWAYHITQLLLMLGVVATTGFELQITLNPAQLFTLSFLLYMGSGDKLSHA